MKKRTRGVIIRLAILTILLLAVDGLFFYVLFANPDGAQMTEYFQSPLVNTEVVYLMLGLCILLLLGLIWLTGSAMRTTASLHKLTRAWEKHDKKKDKHKFPPRFNMLNRIDEEFGAEYRYEPYGPYEPTDDDSNDEEMHVISQKYDHDITLEELCIRFRNYAANRLHLYYQIEDIRRFIAGMGVSKLLILQGMSGTGKTSLAYAMGQFWHNDSVVVPVQPMWKERSDMIGYFNEFTKRFNETTLLRKMYEAGYRKDLYITILDEVNISRIEYYFAEFLSLLEIPDENKRYLDVTSDVWPNDPKQLKNGQIKLPSNMWFVGTANNDDSTFAISDKVYDRAMVISLERKCEPFEAPETEPIYLAYKHWGELITDAKQTYALSEEKEEKIRRLDRYLVENFHFSFGNRIMKQITDYVPICMACGGEELDAIDDILSRKVFRKLESQNPTHVRNAIDGLVSYIAELFGAKSMRQCVEYLELLKNTL